jgi:Na+(H+)/acetate symporter ActP
MKLSHIATVAIMCVSAACSAAAIGLVGQQFFVERSAGEVVVDTAIVERMESVADAINSVPDEKRQALLTAYGYSSRQSFDDALRQQRGDLNRALSRRATELSRGDERLAAVLAACAFASVVSIVGALALCGAASRRPMSRAVASA